MSQVAVRGNLPTPRGAERPIYEHLFTPLFDVRINKSNPAPSRQPLYLKLIQAPGQAQKLATTFHKWEATSLHDIVNCFSLTAHSPAGFQELTIGDQIVRERETQSATGNELDKGKLYDFVHEMRRYLESYPETLFFKIGVILSRIFPCCFSNPEVVLLDRLASISRIEQFVRYFYGPAPVAYVRTAPLISAEPERIPYISDAIDKIKEVALKTFEAIRSFSPYVTEWVDHVRVTVSHTISKLICWESEPVPLAIS